MRTTKTVNNEKILFIKYVENLTSEQKKELMDQIRHHISSSNFYKCLRENKFTKLQQYYLEGITKQEFLWD